MKAHVACLVPLMAFVCAASGETNLTAWTTDAGCSPLKEAPDILYNSVAQGQPTSVIQEGHTVLYQGFLGGAVLMADLDTDGDGVVTVRWMARAGAFYELQGDTDLASDPPLTGLAGIHTPSGGTPPWYEVEASTWLPMPSAPHTAFGVKK